MAIANIRSLLMRRAVLLATAGVLLPLQALLCGVLAVWDDVRSWPGLVRGVWRGHV